MINRITRALARRRDVRDQARQLAWDHGAVAGELARGRSEGPGLSAAQRAFHLAVARAAERRHVYLQSLDTTSRYLEAPRLARSRADTSARL